MSKFTKTDYFNFVQEKQAAILALIKKKNNDYTAGGQEDDPFRNFREAEDFGIDPIAGLCNRMNDKFNRIKAYVKTGKLAVDGDGDGFEDAFNDMIGYSLLALGMLEEKKRETQLAQLEFDFQRPSDAGDMEAPF